MTLGERSGIQIANYRLGRLLGKGGFAEVYEAEHSFVGTKAAVKLLLTSFATEEDIQNFKQEARTIATLNHPNIVRMLDFGISGSEPMPYLLMDFASGGSLKQRHATGTQVSLSNVVSYTNQVAAALQFAHDAHVVHRDVKPENMLIGARGEVLLSDFGIAVAGHSTRSAQAGNFAGTFLYMAPEQISGQPRRASDQYALAVTVYEWLAGRSPFQGTAEEIIAQKFYGSPPPLRIFVTVHPLVEAVVMRGMARDPDQRYPSIATFANALEQAAVGRSTDTLIPPPPPQSKPQPPPKAPAKKTNYVRDLLLIIGFSAVMTIVSFLVGNAGKNGIQPSPGQAGHITASGPNGFYLYILLFGIVPLVGQLAGKLLGVWRGVVSSLLYIVALNIIIKMALPTYVTTEVLWRDMLILSPMLLVAASVGFLYSSVSKKQGTIGCGFAGLVSYVAGVLFWFPAIILSNGIADVGMNVGISLVLAIPMGFVGGILDLFLNKLFKGGNNL